MPLTLSSHAKVNFFLQILGKRADGFHEVRTLMLPIGLADRLVFETLNEPRIELTCSDPALSTGPDNLVRRAAELLQSRHAPKRGARIHLAKQTPIGAGLGGGSSNGSTTLVGLNQLWDLKLAPEVLETLSAEFGSDTAFFVRNRPALSEGRGEILTPIPFPVSLPLFLMNFGFGSATGWAYRNVEHGIRNAESKKSRDDVLEELKKNMDPNSPFSILNSPFALKNDLEAPVFSKFPILKIAKDFLLKQKGVRGAMMCGSGSTMMAILESSDQGSSLQKAIAKKFGASVWTWSGNTLPS